MSIAFTIAAAAKAVLAGRSELDGVTIDIREPAEADATKDAFPLLVITIEAEDVEDEEFGNVAHVAYPLKFTLFQKGNLQPANQTSIQRKWDVREAVRLALHKPGLAGASTVLDSRYEPNPSYDVAAHGDNMRISRQRITFVSHEPRSS